MGIEPVVADLPYPFEVGLEVIRSVGASGFVAALVGVPASWGARRGMDRLGWGRAVAIPTIYLIWLVAALVVFDVPA